ALDFAVISTTHDFEWTSKAEIVLPMASWAEEKGTYTNYAGRVQISARAVAPPGEAMPLHSMMSELLTASGIQVSPDPAAIFDWAARDCAVYQGMSYDLIGPLGMIPPSRAAQTDASQEVAR